MIEIYKYLMQTERLNKLEMYHSPQSTYYHRKDNVQINSFSESQIHDPLR